MDRTHHLLASLTAHPGWEELMKPVIAARVRVYYDQLINPSAARKETVPDDFLRGAIDALKWVVTYPEMELNAHRIAEQEEEAANRELADVVPLFGGGRPDSGNGESHGRGREGGPSSG